MASSPELILKSSGRKGNKKVRTGCLTCKLRKVKCDEAKPHCARCVKTGRKCDGYKTSTSQSLITALGSTFSLAPISVLFTTEAETRAFDHYLNRSAPILSSSVDRGFWSELVVQLTVSQPAVRHAVLALSGLHECALVKPGEINSPEWIFALQEYGKAMGAMRTWDAGRESEAVPLLVCLLFVCIEFLLDREPVSQLHITQGRQILSQMSQNQSPAFRVIKSRLVPIFARLGLVSFLFGNMPPPIPDYLRTPHEPAAELNSLDAAREILYQILEDSLRFTTLATPAKFALEVDEKRLDELQVQQDRLLSRLSSWHTAFTILQLSKGGDPNTASRNQSTLLMIYYHTANVWISTVLQAQECRFDAHVADFAAIITLSSTIINSFASEVEPRIFSFETVVIAPLYWAAIKCRHPVLRRAAVKQLTRHELNGRRENLWSADITALVTMAVIKMEEGSDDIEDDADTRETREAPATAIYEDQASVWLDQPPTMKKLVPNFSVTVLDRVLEDFVGGSPGSRADTDSNGQSPASNATSTYSLSDRIPKIRAVTTQQEPFGVSEEARISNAIIGPKENGGVWITTFRDIGESTWWDMQRKFLKL